MTAPEPKRYFVAARPRIKHGHAYYEVIDRQTDKVVYDSSLEFDAHKRCKKYNDQLFANPGGGANRRR